MYFLPTIILLFRSQDVYGVYLGTAKLLICACVFARMQIEICQSFARTMQPKSRASFASAMTQVGALHGEMQRSIKCSSKSQKS